jgi:hypothetical protein
MEVQGTSIVSLVRRPELAEKKMLQDCEPDVRHLPELPAPCDECINYLCETI